VRRHAKASSAGSNTRQVKDLGRIFRGGFATREASRRADGSGASIGRTAALAAFASALVLLVLIVAPASATKTHFFLEDFGSAAQPSFLNPTSLAVDQSNGDVLVVDTFARTISRYKPDGTPDDFSALGSNVIDGEGAGDETPEGGLQFSSSEFSVRNEVQIAIDNSGSASDGNIYLTQAERHLVYVFAPSGAYLGKLGEYEEGANAGGPLTALGYPCGVGVAPNGTVYVGDSSNGLIHKYAPSANPLLNADNVANFSYPGACTLAVGVGPTAGFIFAVSVDGNRSYPLDKLDASTGEKQYELDVFVNTVFVDPATGDVYAARVDGGDAFVHFDASGDTEATRLAAVDRNGGGAGIAVSESSGLVYLAEGGHQQLRVFSPYQVAADPTALPPTEVSATRARLQGTVNPDGAALTECKFEYGTVESGAFANSVPCEESVPADADAHSVSAAITDLSPNVAYHFRLLVANSNRTSTSAERSFTTPQRAFTGAPTSVSKGAATVSGLVRPEAEQISDCSFEYGPTTTYGASVPCLPASIPASYVAQAVSGALEGLEEFAVYHYKLTFTTAAGTFTGEDELFRTKGPLGLPDNRRYEQVSPVAKNGADIDPGLSAASVEGNRLVIRSIGSFAGAPTSLLSGVPYLSTRGPKGWSTESIAMPGGELAETGYVALMPDLSKGVVLWNEKGQLGTYDPNAQRGVNLYLRDFADPAFTLVNGTLSEAGGFNRRLGFVVWGSSDFSHLAIISSGGLTPEGEVAGCDDASGGSDQCTYEWDNGELRLASIVNGEPVTGTPGTRPGENECGYEHAMSDDGSRLFFTSPPGLNQGGQLYAREDGTTTTLISESERTLPGGLSGEDVNFQNAEATHGDRVLFTTRNSLLDADSDETNDLYLYDYAKPAGERLTLVSADHNPNGSDGAMVDGAAGSSGPCGGVMGASDALRRVYFVADNQIVAGEPEDEGPKLYLWEDNGASATTIYVGALRADDWRAWWGALQLNSADTRLARMSGNGRYLVFLSSAQLTGFDNEGRREVYRYDAVADTLECASCSADASPVNGEIGFMEEPGFAGRPAYNHPTTNVTDQGQVFFHTSRGLVPADSNGKFDVYEYEEGHPRLISGGEGLGDSFFLDATPSGSDVFFTTVDQLVGWDIDENVDAYDARIGGGFPEPSLVPAACQGDACQPAVVAPNDATPASSSFEGAGNVSEPKASRCSKGKVRRNGKCRKKKQARKHSAKQQRQSKPATRSHG
jgi:hypothetical protein